ncbi:MAG TPA: hypothetical protein VGM26_06675 [Rhizomicrobium sp.]
MKSFTVLLAILGSGLTLSALAQTAPPSPPVESVIVTAPAQRPEDALNQFIISHAAPTPALGKIGRWKTGICPVTLGLPDKFNLFVTQRIIRVAMLAGTPLDTNEPCRPNVLVLATPEPQALLDFVRAKRPALLGFHYRPQAQRLSAMRLPIQAWYSTATEDFHGFVSADLPSWDLGYGVMSTSGGAPSMYVSGSRMGDGLKSEFTTAIIIVDTNRIAGQTIGALADYIAMLALSQAQTYDDCQPVPTITNLMSSGCSDGMKPDAITDIDATYLRGLYKMDAGRTLLGERGSIAYAMKKELGGY